MLSAFLVPPRLVCLGLWHGQQAPRELGQSFKRRLLRLIVWRASSSRVLGGVQRELLVQLGAQSSELPDA